MTVVGPHPRGHSSGNLLARSTGHAGFSTTTIPPFPGLISTGALFASQAGVIEAANSAFCGFSGYSETEAVGKPIDFCWEDTPPLSKILEDLLANRSWHGTVMVATARGHRLKLVVNLMQMSQSSGKIVVIVMFSRPIESASTTAAQLSRPDDLTNLLTRADLLAGLHRELAGAHLRQDCGLICIDIDRFHQINATHGLQTGDHVLRRVAAEIRSTLVDGDMLAWNAGDSFVVLIAGIEHGRATVASRLTSLLEILRQPIASESGEICLTASLGGALLSEAGCPDELMRQAELALATAKRGGGNSTILHGAADTARTTSQLLLRADLQHSLARAELDVHFQPIVDCQTLRITAAEALARWHHPIRGLVSPAEFVPIAEETGLIADIGEFVLRRACSEAASWPDTGLGDVALAVNLSHYQTMRGVERISQAISDILAETALPAARLKLELTESCLIENREIMSGWFAQLRSKGIRLALDDFGTGYSSLSYLRHYQVDLLKIDKSFVSDIGSTEGHALVRSIISMAHDLKLAVVAEGVETQAQMQALRALGCDYLQGYLFSRPIPSGEFRQLLIRSTLEPLAIGA